MLESIFYAIGRGFARAWLDVLREKETAELEKVGPDDEKRANNFRDAVDDLQPHELPTPPHGDT